MSNIITAAILVSLIKKHFSKNSRKVKVKWGHIDQFNFLVAKHARRHLCVETFHKTELQLTLHVPRGINLTKPNDSQYITKLHNPLVLKTSIFINF